MTKAADLADTPIVVIIFLVGCASKPFLNPVKCVTRDTTIPFIEHAMPYFEARKFCREYGVNAAGCGFTLSGFHHIVYPDETTRQHEIDHVQCQTAEHVF